MNELVKTIQQLAKAQGKTIKDVAREAGVGENAIYRWSTNEPKISTLRKVADVLGIDYKEKNKRRKVFRQLEHDFKDSFVISRYEDLSKKDFDRAINFITNWYPSYPLQQDIQQMNAQTDLGL